MDKFQAYIKENRHSLDAVDLPHGHVSRFLDKQKLRYGKPKINLWLVASAAAVVGLVLTASLSLLLNFNGIRPSAESDLVSVNLSPELLQINQSYQYQVSQKQQIINKMLSGDSDPLKAEIQLTLNELNDSYDTMLKELAQSPKPERASFVISRYYQSQLAVLEGIITSLSETKVVNQQF